MSAPGPDLIVGTLDDPFKFPEKLIDVTDLADYLGKQYGGWYPVAERYGKKGNTGSRFRKARPAAV